MNTKRLLTAPAATVCRLALLLSLLLGGSRADAIVNGIPTGAKRARNVGTLVVSGDGLPWFWAGCGVTLISPTVGSPPGTVSPSAYRRSPSPHRCLVRPDHAFGAPLPADLEVHEGTDVLHPSFKAFFGGGLPLQDHNDPALADVAAIVFDEPINGVTPAHLPRADDSAVRELVGGPFDVGLVGYGTTSFAAASGGAPFDGGTRRFTTMELDTVYPAVATLAPSPGDTCFFDSGGPAFPPVAEPLPPTVVTLHGLIVWPRPRGHGFAGGTTIMRLDAPHVSSCCAT